MEPISLKKPHWWIGAALKDCHARAVAIPGHGMWLVARKAAYRIDDLPLEHGQCYRVQARKLVEGDPTWYGYSTEKTLEMVAWALNRASSHILRPVLDVSDLPEGTMIPGTVPLELDPWIVVLKNDGPRGLVARRDMTKVEKWEKAKAEMDDIKKKRQAKLLMKGMPI